MKRKKEPIYAVSNKASNVICFAADKEQAEAYRKRKPKLSHSRIVTVNPPEDKPVVYGKLYKFTSFEAKYHLKLEIE